MAREAKPVTCWVVEACSGGSRWLVTFTMRTRRTDALAAWMSVWERGPGTRWAHWRRRGYRLVRCTVTPEVR